MAAISTPICFSSLVIPCKTWKTNSSHLFLGKFAEPHANSFRNNPCSLLSAFSATRIQPHFTVKASSSSSGKFPLDSSKLLTLPNFSAGKKCHLFIYLFIFLNFYMQMGFCKKHIELRKCVNYTFWDYKNLSVDSFTCRLVKKIWLLGALEK